MAWYGMAGVCDAGSTQRTMMKEKSPSETSFQTSSESARKPIQAVIGELRCFPSIRIMRSTCMFMLPPLGWWCVGCRGGYAGVSRWARTGR